MTDHPVSSSSFIVGEFSRQDAFAAARTLEHAGITTELKGQIDTYRVVVAQEHAQRALSLV
jgi:hypothetical protein